MKSRMSSVLFAVTLISLLPQIVLAAVGRTSGSLDISATGAANYTIPIWVPPGPKGMQPHLALSYDSRGSNSIAGVGWSLSGLSSIDGCCCVPRFHRTLSQIGIIRFREDSPEFPTLSS